MTEKKLEKIYSLLEAVADIAYIAGSERYYGGNSREDIETFIYWALEFEKKYKGEVWGEERDYIDTIYEFTEEKLKQLEEKNIKGE